MQSAPRDRPAFAALRRTPFIPRRSSATLHGPAGVRAGARWRARLLAPERRSTQMGKYQGRFVARMLACSFILLMSAEAVAGPGGAAASGPHAGACHIASARAQQRRPLPSPTIELRRSTEALRKTLSRRHPSWSPEAEAQATAVQTVVDGLLDFDEIAKRTLASQWDGLTAGQRRDFLEALQRLIERKPLDRGLQIDFDSTVAYHGESVIDDEAVVSSIVTSTATTGRASRRLIQYKLCYRGGRWRVYDVIVEGVSLVDDYRDQFAKIIAQDSFDGLLRRMRKKGAGESE